MSIEEEESALEAQRDAADGAKTMATKPKSIAIVGAGEFATFDGKVNGREAKIGEMFRLRGPNGWEGAIIRATVEDRTYGPLVAYPPGTEGWGYDWEPQRNERNNKWDICIAMASAMYDVLKERDEIIAKAKAVLIEVQSAGFLNRSDDVILALDEMLGSYDENIKQIAQEQAELKKRVDESLAGRS
jgi:hypothetical protein